MAKNNTTKLDAGKLREGDSEELKSAEKILDKSVKPIAKRLGFTEDDWKDMRQDTIMKFEEKLNKDEIKSNIEGYLYRTGYNEVKNVFRNNKRHGEIEEQMKTTNTTTININQIDLKEFLATLSEIDQEIANLYNQHYTYKEIAEKTDTTKDFVDDRLQEIKHKGREFFGLYSTLFAIFTWLTQFWKNRS